MGVLHICRCYMRIFIQIFVLLECNPLLNIPHYVSPWPDASGTDTTFMHSYAHFFDRDMSQDLDVSLVYLYHNQLSDFGLIFLLECSMVSNCLGDSLRLCWRIMRIFVIYCRIVLEHDANTTMFHIWYRVPLCLWSLQPQVLQYLSIWVENISTETFHFCPWCQLEILAWSCRFWSRSFSLGWQPLSRWLYLKLIWL